MNIPSLFSIPILKQGKDLLLGQAVMGWFNQAKQHLGKMTTIKIDSQNKNIELDLELKGETSPLRIQIQNYRLITESKETFIELTDVTTSREWINALLSDYPQPEKRRFKVPAAVKMLL
jgi:hypothetical protein